MRPAQQALDLGGDSAWFSKCGRYRYILSRLWNMVEDPRLILWVMLNPSTADDVENDPTVSRCIGFSKRDGFDGLIVCNVFALRATDPAEMINDPNPVGPDNDKAIMESLDRCEAVVLACGNIVNGVWGGAVRFRALVKAIRRESHVPLCLGTNQTGLPKHPLYVKGDTPLVPYIERTRP